MGGHPERRQPGGDRPPRGPGRGGPRRLGDAPDVQFVDTWDRFSSRNGGWAEYVVDPRDGVGKDVRADDGFHLNQNGAEILALDITDIVTADLRARGAAALTLFVIGLRSHRRKTLTKASATPSGPRGVGPSSAALDVGRAAA